jgi:hypothetical protein
MEARMDVNERVKSTRRTKAVERAPLTSGGFASSVFLGCFLRFHN